MTDQKMPRLKKIVKQHLEKARSSALSAVENYNKPGIAFRTRTYTILMILAWTALLHAIFYRRGDKPWYVRQGEGRSIRYKKIDGEPKHWELGECLHHYFGDHNPAERKNLEFMIRLRNKIEQRNQPELDPALYVEFQAMLKNFEDLLKHEFGTEHALSESLSVSLQFSTLRQKEQEEALKRLQRSAARYLINFIERFRSNLPPEILASSRYSLKVFLLPKIANRESAADLAVEFVHYDPTKPEEMNQLRQIAAIIKEKHIPVASSGLMRASDVVEKVNKCLPFEFKMVAHVKAWKYYAVRPPSGSDQPEITKTDFCIYDKMMRGYGYTEAWVKFLCRKLSNALEFRMVTGREPIIKKD